MRRPIRDFIFGKPKSGTDPEKELPELARAYRRGIAEAIGVPPEAIKEEKVKKWYRHFVKALVKPRYWQEAFSSPNKYEVRQLGRQIGKLIRDGINEGKELPKPIQNYAKSMSEITGIPEEEVKESESYKKYKRKYM